MIQTLRLKLINFKYYKLSNVIYINIFALKILYVNLVQQNCIIV